MSEERAKRLSQIFDPLSKLTEMTKINIQSVSTPTSPMLMPRKPKDVPPVPPPRFVYYLLRLYLLFVPVLKLFFFIFRPSQMAFRTAPASASTSGSASPEGDVNWQDKCLALQLELHRSRAQSIRARDMLREKVRISMMFFKYSMPTMYNMNNLMRLN